MLGTVTNMFTEADVSGSFDTYTQNVGGILATAVGVGFALLAVGVAITMIRRYAKR